MLVAPDPEAGRMQQHYLSASLFLARVCAVLVWSFGATALLGYSIDQVSLTQLFVGGPSMSPATALAFALVAICLYCRAAADSFPLLHRLHQLLAASVAAACALRVGAHAGLWQFPIDLLLFNASGPAMINRPVMAPATALAFVAAGIALMPTVDRRLPRLAHSLALMITAIAWLGLCNFVVGAQPLSIHFKMAANTASGFLLLGAGLVAARPDIGLGALLCTDSAGGRLVRKLLPIGALISLLLIIVLTRLIAIEDRRPIDPREGIVLVATLLLVAVTYVGVRLGADLDRYDSARRKSIADLLASEARFRGIFEATAGGALLSDAAGTIVLANEPLARISGYPVAELIGQPMEMLFPHRYRQAHREQRAGLLRVPAGEPAGAMREQRVLRKDGSECPVEIGLSAIVESERTLVLATIIDTTDRERAALALRDSEQRVRLATEASGVGIWQWDLRTNQVQWDAEMFRIYGMDPTPDGFVTYADWRDAVLPEDLEDQERILHDMVARCGQGRREFRILRRGERQCRFIEAVDVVRTGADGKATWIIGTNRDVTEARRAEEADRTLASVVSSSYDAIISKDMSGIVTSWNAGAEALFGYSAEAMVGQPITRLFPPELIAEEREILGHIIDGKQIVNRDTVRVRSDGTRVDVSVTISPIRDAHGQIIGASKIAHDITARREAELMAERRAEDLQRSNAELEQFAYIASHDLQEPLRMVASFVQLLATRYADRLDDRGREYIGFAVDGARRMQQMVQDLLAFARVGRRGELVTAAVDLNGCYALACQHLEHAIAESQAVVEAAELPIVRGVELQLVQVLQNLIGNAIKYRGEERPRVRVDAVREGPFWRLTVRDNGIGIEPQYFDRIFVIFQRLHQRENYSGTGIGLAICKRIIEAHGGRIWVESAPGQGSTFSFVLPAAAGAAVRRSG